MGEDLKINVMMETIKMEMDAQVSARLKKGGTVKKGHQHKKVYVYIISLIVLTLILPRQFMYLEKSIKEFVSHIFPSSYKRMSVLYVINY